VCTKKKGKEFTQKLALATSTWTHLPVFGAQLSTAFRGVAQGKAQVGVAAVLAAAREKHGAQARHNNARRSKEEEEVEKKAAYAQEKFGNVNKNSKQEKMRQTDNEQKYG